jgi:uncharacterized RDD family membrane protein YckC
MLVLFGVLAFTFLVPHLIIGVLFEVTAPSAILMAHMYLVLAFYFMWYWTKTGQTLAMQTWRIQLFGFDGKPLQLEQAMKRYVIASFGLMFFGLGFIWAIFDRQGLYLHDRLTGGRLVALPRK